MLANERLQLPVVAEGPEGHSVDVRWNNALAKWCVSWQGLTVAFTAERLLPVAKYLQQPFTPFRDALEVYEEGSGLVVSSHLGLLADDDQGIGLYIYQGGQEGAPERSQAAIVTVESADELADLVVRHGGPTPVFGL